VKPPETVGIVPVNLITVYIISLYLFTLSQQAAGNVFNIIYYAPPLG